MAYDILTPGELASAGAVFSLLCIVLSTVRLLTKRKLHAGWGADDWLIIPACLMVVGMGVATMIGVAKQSVAHFTPPPDAATGNFAYEERVLLIILWSIDLMQVVALACIKVSLMFYYRTIFNVQGGSGMFNIASLVVIVVIAMWAIAFFFGFLLNCPGHFSAEWTSYALNLEYCWSTQDFLLWYSWTDFVTDVIVLVFPIPSVLKLQMPLKRKIAVIFIFAIGAMAIAASTVRASLFTEFVKSYSVSYDLDSKSPEQCHHLLLTVSPVLYSNGIYWIVIETGFGLCTINLPIIYNLARHQSSQAFFSRLRNSLSLRSSRSGDNTSAGSAPPSWRQPQNGSNTKEVNAHVIGKYERSGRSEEYMLQGNLNADEAGRMSASRSFEREGSFV